MRSASLVASMLPILVMACFDVPPPLAHRLVEEPGEGGSGHGGAQAMGGSGGSGGSGGAGGEGGSSPTPQPVCDGPDDLNCARVLSIAAGESHACVSMSDGTVRCWGNNDSYQLGEPTTPQGYFAGPVVVAGLREPSAIRLGARHSCALDASAALHCWGRNHFGQLGTGDTVFRDVPTHVADGLTMIGAWEATCARSDVGAVVCWGLLLNGQEWNGDFGAYSPNPAPVDLGGPATDVVVASRHACAVVEDGASVKCWGRGNVGQLGDGSLMNSAAPVAVSPVLEVPVKRIDAGAEQTCVLAGQPPVVQCWGELPVLGMTPTPTALPVQPDGEVVDLQIGWRHACALLADGRVQCWGVNYQSALGRTGADSATPSDVTDLTDAAMLAVGDRQSCVVRLNGRVACWGSNDAGALGASAAISDSPTPLDVDLEVAP